MEFGVEIIGMGIHLPSKVRTNDYWSDDTICKWRERLIHILPPLDGAKSNAERLYRKALHELKNDVFLGARERRVIDDDQVSSDLEALAAKAALRNALILPEAVDLLLSHTMVPDYICVNGAAIVHHKVGLRADTPSISVDAVCMSFLAQMQVARQNIVAKDAKFVLATQSTACTRIMPDDHPLAAWSGDGAAASVIGVVDKGLGLLSCSFRTEGSLSGGFVATVPGKRWYDEGRVVATTADREAAARMQEVTLECAEEVIDEALSKAGVKKHEVRFFACHQPNAWLCSVVRQASGLENAKFIDVFPWTTSLSSATIPLQLSLGIQEGMIKKGDPLVIYSIASGLSLGAAVMRWSY